MLLFKNDLAFRMLKWSLKLYCKGSINDKLRKFSTMMSKNIPSIQETESIFQGLRHFADNDQKSYTFRKKKLELLKKIVLANADAIAEAIGKDLGKHQFETYLSDVGVIAEEINFILKNLKMWMQPEEVPTPMAIFPSTNTTLYHEPKGVVLIFSPWNYPVNLSLIPLAGAVAAGNAVLLKPAHETPNAAAIIEKIISEVFDKKHVSVIQGEGKAIGPLLLDNFRFDHIFFTGSPQVGKWIMEKAAKNLTPVTLELGGKSPVIIDKNSNLKIAVNRIIWGKMFSAGQTCIAPDYALVHEDVKEDFLKLAKEKIHSFYGPNPQESPYLARIVSKERCEKLAGYLNQGKIIHGGNYDIEKKYIEPTLIEINDLETPVMMEEIFGPILPVISWKSRDEILHIIRKNRYPLACYVYSTDKKFSDFVIRHVEFGSGCINDNLVQFVNNKLPFGGIQNSGVGRYHGKFSFDAFSHTKGVVKTMSNVDHSLKYPPYSNWKMKLSKWFLE
jgi:aldehyde dehydrogenase (NAD+)